MLERFLNFFMSQFSYFPLFFFFRQLYLLSLFASQRSSSLHVPKLIYSNSITVSYSRACPLIYLYHSFYYSFLPYSFLTFPYFSLPGLSLSLSPILLPPIYLLTHFLSFSASHFSKYTKKVSRLNPDLPTLLGFKSTFSLRITCSRNFSIRSV